MRLVLGVIVAVVAGLALWLWFSGHYAQAMQWAIAQQRIFQNELAGFVMAARRGESGVILGLIAASGFYGFAHALGPGHGKFLLGGAGLGSHATARTMAGLAVASSLAQGLTAVVLVYGGLGILSVGTRWAEGVTNDVLTPLSYAVIALIGAVLIWRGVKAMRPLLSARPQLTSDHAHAKPHDHVQHTPHHHAHHDHVHSDACGCGHRHGPTVEEVRNLTGWRDALALIAGIAVRPCTGAVIVLVFAWQFDLHLLGFVAVLAMALGTGAFTAMVALASVLLREASFFASGAGTGVSLLAPTLQLLAGGLIMIFSLGLLWASLI
ncbi:MAG: hypothetical protein AAF674_03710 [Pseudomonadota bacterium]